MERPKESLQYSDWNIRKRIERLHEKWKCLMMMMTTTMIECTQHAYIVWLGNRISIISGSIQKLSYDILQRMVSGASWQLYNATISMRKLLGVNCVSYGKSECVLWWQWRRRRRRRWVIAKGAWLAWNMWKQWQPAPSSSRNIFQVVPNPMNITCNRESFSRIAHHQFYCSRDDLQFRRSERKAQRRSLMLDNSQHTVTYVRVFVPLMLKMEKAIAQIQCTDGVLVQCTQCSLRGEYVHGLKT